MDEIINETIYYCAFRFIDTDCNQKFFDNIKIFLSILLREDGW